MLLAYFLQTLTFGSYLQTLGIILAQWFPVAGLFYLAVRLGIQHAVAHLTRKMEATDKVLDQLRDIRTP